MKKIALVMSVIMITIWGIVPVFAQPSIEVGGTVTIDKAEDKNGNKLELILGQLGGAHKEKLDEILKPEKLKELLGDDYSEKLQLISGFKFKIVDSKKGVISDKKSKQLSPLKITFKVPGVNKDSKVVVLGFYDGAWHVLSGLILGDGTVTGEFDQTMPIAFMVDGKKVSGTKLDESDVKSPKTGDDMLLYIVAGIAAVSCVCVMMSRKKKSA